MILSNNFKDFLQTPSWFFFSFGSLFYSKVAKDLEILNQEDDVTEELIIDEEENEGRDNLEARYRVSRIDNIVIFGDIFNLNML